MAKVESKPPKNKVDELTVEAALKIIDYYCNNKEKESINTILRSEKLTSAFCFQGRLDYCIMRYTFNFGLYVWNIVIVPNEISVKCDKIEYLRSTLFYGESIQKAEHVNISQDESGTFEITRKQYGV